MREGATVLTFLWTIKDIDECQSSPCTDENEECINSPGSYECNCKPDYNREDGTCVPIPEEEEDDEPTENSNAGISTL